MRPTRGIGSTLTANVGKALGALLMSTLLFGAPAFAEDLQMPRIPDPCPDGATLLAAQTPADEALETRVERAIDSTDFERLTEIRPVAIGGIVCLRGTAANSTDRQRAETVAAAVAGVVEVVNRLKIPLAQ